jgi:membrane protease YdiL (CAAX protease family)
MTEGAAFCVNCGQDRPGAPRPKLLQEPAAAPNFHDRVGLQGGNAMRLLIALLATMFGSTVLILLILPDSDYIMLYAGIAMAISTTLCALPEAEEIRRLFAIDRVLRPMPWIAAIVVTPFLPLLAELWIAFLGIHEPEGYDSLEGMTPFMAFLTIAVMPGIFEELAFRGVVLGNLRHMLSLRNAHLLTAFLFTAIHFSPLIFPYHFIIALFLGWLRHRSGSLLVPMFAHALHNAVIVFIYDAA